MFQHFNKQYRTNYVDLGQYKEQERLVRMSNSLSEVLHQMNTKTDVQYLIETPMIIVVYGIY